MSERDKIQELVAEMEERRKSIHRGGGEERIARQHAAGKRTARERLALLLDDDSFQEIGTFVETDPDPNGRPPLSPGEGVVTGHGTVRGRRVFVFAQDFTVAGGSLGRMHAAKIARIMDLAVAAGCPIVGLNDSAGARIQEGVDALAGYGEVFRRNARYSGVVPQVSAILGPCAGGAVYSPALTDFVVMSRVASMFITGPEVVRQVTREQVDQQELGGAEVHARRSGVAHLVFDDDEEVLRRIRELLSYLPDSARVPPPLRPSHDPWNRATPELAHLVPVDPKRAYPMREVIRSLVDEGRFLELQPLWARNIVTGFAHLDGRSIGVVANDPGHLAGSIDIDASDKAARFVRTCDAFSVPLLTLVDVAGFLPGVAQEHGGIIRHGAKMLYAYAEATVPKLTLTVRKSYGGAYLAMAAKSMGTDVALAWPTASVAVMGAEGAAAVLHRREIAAADDPDAVRTERIRAYRARYDNPWRAAANGDLDDVVDPARTRAALVAHLRALSDKHEQLPYRKHGNVPL